MPANKTNSSTRSYTDHPYWRGYQAFFPAHLAIGDAECIEEDNFVWRSLNIHLDRYRVQNARATVILVHGAGGYGRLFAPMGKLLQGLGYEVIAPDLPGYGLSQAPTNCVDYAAWTDLLVDLVARTHKQYARPIVLLGGSIGGYLAYLCAAQSPHVAGVIATTLADTREPDVRRDLTKNRLLQHLGLPLLKYSIALTGHWRLPVKWFTHMDRMSNQPALAKRVMEDPLGGGNKVPLRLLQSLFAVTPAVEPEDFTQCPVLLAHPAEDTWTKVESSLLFFNRLKVNKRLVLLDNCGHFPVEQPGLAQFEVAVSDFMQTVVDRT
jgi:alpha-beta hydrolase superfamily lysophospholipase